MAKRTEAFWCVVGVMLEHTFGNECLGQSLQNMQGAHSIARCSRKALTRRSTFRTNKLIGQSLQNMQRAHESQGAQLPFHKTVSVTNPDSGEFEGMTFEHLFQSIVHSHEVKSLRRSRFPRMPSIARFEDSTHVVRSPTASSDMNQRADDGADHVVQKAVRFNVKTQERRAERRSLRIVGQFRNSADARRSTRDTRRFPDVPSGRASHRGMKDCANAGRAVGPLCFKATKVMRPDKTLNGGVHRRIIQSRPLPKDHISKKWNPNRAVVNDVAIPFSFGVVTGVEARRGELDIANYDVIRQVSGQPVQESVAWSSRARCEARHLTDGVYARIRSPRRHDSNRFTSELEEGLLDDSL